MKALLALLAIFLLAVPCAAAAETTQRNLDVTFIPEKLSIGSAFIMLADLQTGVNEVVRISIQSPFVGQIPKEGSKWMCYFSNTDPNANCGPSPFSNIIFSGEQQLIITSSNQSITGDNPTGCFYNCNFDSLNNVTVGGVTLSSTYGIKNNVAGVVVKAYDIVDYVSYDVYNSKFEKQANLTGNMTKDELDPTLFKANMTLDYGTWWIAFYAPTSGGDWGSYLSKVVVGTEAPTEPSLLAFGRHINVMMMSGETWTSAEQCCIKNTLDRSVDVRTNVTPELSSFLSIQLTNSTLEPLGSTRYKITLSNLTVAEDIITYVDLLDENNTVVGQLPVNVSATVMGGALSCPPAQTVAGALSVSPTSWSADTVAGQPISKTFTLTNGANESYNLTSSSSGFLGLNVTMPNKIEANDTVTIQANATFTSSGAKSGELSIKTDGKALAIPVLITVYQNMTTSINSVADDLGIFVENLTETQKSDLYTAISSINTSLATARTKFAAGSYNDAQTALKEAQAKLDMLQSVYTVTPPETPPSFDVTAIILPLVIVVVVVVGGFFAFKFLKKRGKEKPMEKELEEEF